MEEAKSTGIFIARQLLRQNQLNFWGDLPTGEQAAVFQRLINGVVLEVCSTRPAIATSQPLHPTGDRLDVG